MNVVVSMVGMARLDRDPEREVFWRLALSEQRASGLSVRGFCRREGLKEASFYGWRRGVARRDAEGDRPTMPDAPAASPVFVEVKVGGEGRGSEAAPIDAPPLEVVLPAGLVVRVRAGFDAATLRRVVEALS